MTVKVGFGRDTLWGSWPTKLPLHDDIDVRVMVLVDGDGNASALAAADVDNMWPSVCLRMRQAIADRIGAPPERVGIFTTQNHSVATRGPDAFDLDAWERAFVRAAGQAHGAAQPAAMAYVEVDPQPPRVVNRRKRFGEMGSFCFWHGYEVTADGRVGCARLLEAACRGLLAGLETPVRSRPPAKAEAKLDPRAGIPDIPADAALDAPADTLIQAIFFRSPSGEPIGSFSRLAAHPCTANVSGSMHTGDYPAYLRRRLSERFGGGALFLTGPCGDQAPLIESKSLELARRIGTDVADLLLDGLREADWREVESVRAVSVEVELPVRRDYPDSPESARRGLAEARRRFRELVSSSGSLKELKATLEEVERLEYAAGETQYELCGVRPESLEGRVLRHPLFAASIGDVVIAGLPGEPFGGFSLQLRDRFRSLKLVVVDECNGYVTYVPTTDEYPLGGYGPALTFLAPECEAILISGAAELIEGKLLPGLPG